MAASSPDSLSLSTGTSVSGVSPGQWEPPALRDIDILMARVQDPSALANIASAGNNDVQMDSGLKRPLPGLADSASSAQESLPVQVQVYNMSPDASAGTTVACAGAEGKGARRRTGYNPYPPDMRKRAGSHPGHPEMRPPMFAADVSDTRCTTAVPSLRVWNGRTEQNQVRRRAYYHPNHTVM
jgi:hypothetical protein